MLVEHEYERNGTLAYLAALDIGRRGPSSRRPRIFGRCESKAGKEPFGRLVEQIMTTEPYASAKPVFWVVDNGSSHAAQASIDRLEGAYENLRLIHLPIHASWLNPIEIYFSIVQRKALTPKRLLIARRARGSDHGLRAPLAGRGRALRVELHPPRSRSAAGASLRAQASTTVGCLMPDGTCGRQY
jgi:hypothetical protein